MQHQYKANTFNICTINVRSLLNESRMEEFDHALKDIKWDIVGISETRLQGEEILERNDGSLFCYKGETKGLHGVGILVHKDMKRYVEAVRLYTERTLAIKFKLKNTSLTIIQVYAPTCSSNEKQIEDFYENIKTTITEFKSENIIVMGDFNAKVGQMQDGEEKIMGPHGLGTRNDRGETLITWLWQENFCVTNTLFQKKDKNKWTWCSPDERTKNQIDYILTNKKSIFNDVSTIPSFKFETDHRLIRAKVTINHKTRKLYNHQIKKTLPNMISDEAKRLYLEELKNQILLNDDNNRDIQKKYNFTENAIKAAADRYLNIPCNRKHDKLSEDTKKLINEKQLLQKKQFKSSEEKCSLKRMKKQIKINIKQDVQKCDNLIKETLVATESIKKKLKMRYRKEKIVYQVWKKLQGNTLREVKSIKMATEFYRELYSSTQVDEHSVISSHYFHSLYQKKRSQFWN